MPTPPSSLSPPLSSPPLSDTQNLSDSSEMQYHHLVNELSAEHKEKYQSQGMILSLSEFLDLVRQNPGRHMRGAPEYLCDMIDFYGSRPSDHPLLSSLRYTLFDGSPPDYPAVVSGEGAQENISKALRSFARIGRAYKLIVLHGPNGSSKSSTINALSSGLERYSREQEGAIYRFSWIFPKDKELTATHSDEGAIGFSTARNPTPHHNVSFVDLDESKVACRIDSEFKENPLFLLPMPYRQNFLASLYPDVTADKNPDELIPQHLRQQGLSKKNQQIFEQLLGTYRGDVIKVFRHVQVQRFYFSRQYRVGIATVEPQMSLDARERQLTVDRYMRDLPACLQTLSFFEYSGELVEANRGLVEFSDFLKRPLESFKYLLSTIETGAIHLPSATAVLDTVFVATTNDKHWDAFGELADFQSFFGRIHLTCVPYLLRARDEMKIYQRDVELISRDTTIAPHTLEMLALWAVMTRIRPPLLSEFTSEQQSWLKTLTALGKAKLYNEDVLPSHLGLSKPQRLFLKRRLPTLIKQFAGRGIYEGKTGASPRNVRDILHHAAQSCADHHLTALDIFEHLSKLTKNKKLYEFLRNPPPGELFHPEKFVAELKKDYLSTFEEELHDSISMVEEIQYEQYLSRYITHVVADTRGEKIFDSASNSYVAPQKSLMSEVEKIIGTSADQSTKFRRSILSRIAAWKIDNPTESYSVGGVFADHLRKIKHHFYSAREQQVLKICRRIIQWTTAHNRENLPDSDPTPTHDHLSPSQRTSQRASKSSPFKGVELNDKEIEEVRTTLKNLNERYGYHQVAVVRSLKALIAHNKI